MKLIVGDPKSIQYKKDYEISLLRKCFRDWWAEDGFNDNAERSIHEDNKVVCPECNSDMIYIEDVSVNKAREVVVEFTCDHRCNCPACDGCHRFTCNFKETETGFDCIQ